MDARAAVTVRRLSLGQTRMREVRGAGGVQERRVAASSARRLRVEWRRRGEAVAQLQQRRQRASTPRRRASDWHRRAVGGGPIRALEACRYDVVLAYVRQSLECRILSNT